MNAVSRIPLPIAAEALLSGRGRLLPGASPHIQATCHEVKYKM